MKMKFILPSVMMASSLFVYGQKKPLDHNVYDSWQSLGSRAISNDGKWVGYTVDPQEGDSKLYLYPLNATVPAEFSRGSRPFFTSDSKYAFFSIKPFFKDQKAVKDKKMKKDKLAKDSLGIYDLTNQKIEKIPNVLSFKSPLKGGSWIAYLLADLKDKTPDAEAKDDDEKKDDDAGTKPSTLIVQNLISGKKYTYENVTKYQFSENGKGLVFVTKKPEDKDKDKKKDDKPKKEEPKDKSKPKKFALQSVNWVDLDKGSVNKVAEQEGDFTQMNFDKIGSQLAFIGTSSAQNDLVKDYQLYYFGEKNKSNIDNQNTKMPQGWVVSENRMPIFSKNGKQLYFGIAPKPIAKDTALIANDHAVVDVWNYKDDYLQTVQLKNLSGDLKKSYGAVIQTDKPATFQRLDDEKMDTVRMVSEGNASYVLGMENLDSRIASQWLGSDRRTYSIINNLTGAKTVFVKDLNGMAVPSPLGKYMVYFNRENGNWYAYNVETKATNQLNVGVKVPLVNEENDVPDKPGAYGIASWTDNDESVIIKDRYDLWEFFLNGKKPPRNITNGFGRANKITFNTYDLDPDIKSLNRKKSIYISAFNNDTKKEGIYETTIDGGKDPKKIAMNAVWGYRTLQKAKNADEYIFSKETYVESPNLYATKDFKEDKKLSNTNPQQQNYNWGTDELVQWTTPKGNKSTGILYKPENFDPNKTYPMIVYFYEKLSDGLNRYVAPAPTPSRLNISYFVSNGYLVFTPDISYVDGHPGQSAVEYINSGVESLKKNSWVDGKHIGIQGQSWGGYQVAYLITVNDMYAAAWAGAPVANMTSAYGGIRWGSGANRQMQYEKQQSRIGKTIWEARDLYIENSPLFHFDNVKTPVVVMANDKDGAVPWYQGIEMFTALRRLGKKVWMLNYNGDDHNLTKRQNKKDIQIREQQFFDYYLKGAQAPVWMTKGIPATMKGKDWGFELTNDKP